MQTKNVQDLYPLSPMQQGMLFHSLLAPDSGVYVGQLGCELEGPLDLDAFGRAWRRVLERHPILRTGFLSGDLKEPVQVVHREVALPIEELDLRDLAPEARERRVAEHAEGELRRGFDLARPPLLRLALLRTGETRRHLVWTYHHILIDGWSLPLVLREVFAYYDAFRRGADLALPLPPPFRSYIAWLRKQDMAGAEAFWRRSLAGFTEPTPLPIERPEPVDGSDLFPELALDLPESSSAAVQQLARRLGVTLNTVVQGAWALLLSRYAGVEDVVFGSAVSGRPPELPGVEQIVGLFINTLPVRVRVPGDAALGDWLRELHARQAELRQYEFTPLHQIQAWSEVPRGVPLFESIFVFENFPVAGAVAQDGTGAASDDGDAIRLGRVHAAQQTNYGVTLVVEPGERMQLRVSFDTRRYDPEAIHRLLGHLATLLDGFAAAPGAPLASFPLLTARERRQAIDEWNATARPLASERWAHERVADQARSRPEAEAVVFGDERLTYAELERRAERLAAHLVGLGVGPEVPVGLCVAPSLEMAVGILGVLKAGGAYLPLEPTYPAERLAYMVADARPPVLLTQAALAGTIAGYEGAVVCLDRDWPRIEAAPAVEPPALSADSLAYVIYTSGSTGRPKGTLLTHGGLRNLTEVLVDRFAVTPASRVLQFAAFSFDASVSEVVMALAAGATLVLAPRDVLASGDDLLALLRRERITTVTLPPSLLAVLPDEALPALETVVSAGEACPWEVAERWSRGRRFLNGYGPTETTVAASYHLVTGAVPGTRTVPIGGPNANTRMYLLDRHGHPVPLGVPGELYIGGVGVGRGYLGRPELTAERFLPDPFAGTPGARMYRTGDLARRLPDGNLEFVGRIDGQVKLRGFRIELGEIEAVLASHPAVQAAAATVREDRAGHRRLVAYVVAAVGEHPSTAELTDFLRTRLPPHFVPSAVVALDALPVTPNGKVDRKALPAPDRQSDETAAPYVAPRTPDEEIIAAVWAQVLGVPRVGVHDGFFELGGHSILATQLVARVRDACQVELPLAALFESPTVEGLARAVGAARRAALGDGAARIVPAPRGSELPLSFAQQRLWFLDQLEPGSPLYNIPTAVRIGGAIDPLLLRRAIGAVIERHESLRTTVQTVDGRPRQLVGSAEEAFEWTYDDLTALDEAAREALVARRVREEAQRPFDLARGPLVRVVLLRTGEREHVGLFTMHHIVSDGWSMGIFVRELGACYAAFRDGRPAPLAPLEIQYADFAAWQRAWLSGERLEAELEYWRAQLAGAPALLELPADRPRPAVMSYEGDYATFLLPPDVTDRLRSLAQATGTTLFMVLLAAWQTLLARYSGQEDVCVGTPVAGRNRAELEGLIGFFVNTLVLRTDLSGDPSFRDLLKRVRATALGAYAHQELPFEMVVDALHVQRSLSHTPLFQVMFALQNTGDRLVEQGGPSFEGGLEVRALEARSGTAKFDLTLEMMETGDGLGGTLEYATDLFDAATARRMLEHFSTLLAAAATNPDRPISALPLSLEPARPWAATEVGAALPAGRPERCLHELFEAQVGRTPDAPAVTDGATTLTYAELAARARRLARHLAALGVGRGAVVAIRLDRSAEQIAAILGALEAGAACLPLDPADPAARVEALLAEAGARVLVTSERLEAVDSPPGLTVVRLDADAAALAAFDGSSPASRARPDDAAFVFATANAEGRPTLQAVSHAELATLAAVCRAELELGGGDVWAFAHDAHLGQAMLELWGALLHGGRLAVVGDAAGAAADEFGALLGREGVTVLVTTPTAFRALVRSEESGPMAGGLALRHVVLSGEAPDLGDVGAWFRRRPAERTGVSYLHAIGAPPCFVSLRPLAPADVEAGHVHRVGRPLPGVRVDVLDRHGAQAPVGVPGELCVLASEGRVVRTGDRARWLADGELEVLGRLDRQVAMRGMRVQPAEIEAALLTHPAVTDAAVAVRREGSGEPRLVAYLAAQAIAPSEGELRALLARMLPAHMVPDAFVVLDALPRTHSGAVDHAALPAPDAAVAGASAAHLAPATEAERTLAAIWSELLGVDRIGRDDDFFALGGDSILTIQVIGRAREAGLHLTPRDFFRDPTLRALAAAGLAGPAPDAEQESAAGPVPLTPIQRWFFEHHPDHPAQWNTSIMLEVDEPLRLDLLGEAMDALLRHHDALRLRFERTAAGWSQRLGDPPAAPPVDYIDLSGVSRWKQRQAVEEAAARVQRGFDLAAGPLVRLAWMDLGPKRPGRLLIVFHHLVADAVSLRIFLGDLLTAYRRRLQGEPIALAPRSTSFRRWAGLLVELARSAEVRAELPYWASLADEPPAPLPTDRDGRNSYGAAERVFASLTQAETQLLLRELPAAGLPVNDVLLAALARTIQDWTGDGRLLVEFDSHGRHAAAYGALDGADLSRTIGWFTSVYPVRLDVRGCADRLDAVRAVGEQLSAVPGKGLGWGLLRHLAEEPEVRERLGRVPQPEVSFNYLGQFDQPLAGGTEGTLPVRVAAESVGAEQHPDAERAARLYVVAIVAGGQLDLMWSYPGTQYKRARIERLAKAYVAELRAMLAACRAGSQPVGA